jgi:hypothetical protein
MDIRKELDKKISKKREEIDSLQNELQTAKTYLQALEDTRKLLPRNPVDNPTVTLRPGTDLSRVRVILQEARAPLHVEDLLKRLGKPVEKKSKLSLSGSLASYARDNKIFTRPAPNTFGLVEFEAGAPTDEPPEDFGLEFGTKSNSAA